MKYSQTIGVIAALALIVACFLPWSYIPGQHLTITGLRTSGTSFGRPGILAITTACISALLFIIPKIWAKRANVMVAAVSVSWAVRNYLLFTACMMGECPEIRIGLRLLLLFAIGVLLMSFLPKIEVNDKK